jgi:hypothetical protein
LETPQWDADFFTTERHTKAAQRRRGFTFRATTTWPHHESLSTWAISIPPSLGRSTHQAQDARHHDGNVYPLELFHAERHTTASHFRVDTTLTFVDCGSIPADVH